MKIKNKNQEVLLSYGSINCDNMHYSGIVFLLANNKYNVLYLKNVEIIEFNKHHNYIEILLKGYNCVILCSCLEIGFCTNVPKRKEYIYYLVPSLQEPGLLSVSKSLKVKAVYELPYKIYNTIYIVENEKGQSFAIQLYKQD